MILTVATVAIVGATLLGSNYSTSQLQAMESDPILEQIHAMGGLQFVMPEAFAETDCGALEDSGRTVVEFNLTGESVFLPTMVGNADGQYYAMTFNGQVPGPTLRVTQGDVVKMTLAIPSSEATAHGNDMHSSQMSSAFFGAVHPGESSTYCYIAESAGVFKYHCSGVDLQAMDEHVLSGMYGIAIVDPLDGYGQFHVEKTKVVNGEVKIDRQLYGPDALEFQLQYNQQYVSTVTGGYDFEAMKKHQHTATVVNGMQFGYVPNGVHNHLIAGDADTNIFVAQPWNSSDEKQYQSQLLYVELDQPVRLFVENQGNEPVFFHIVGEILDRVTQGNRVQSHATETWLLGGSQNMIVDLVFDEPGTYAAVNHDYAAIYTGAATVFVADDYFDLNPTLASVGLGTGGSYAYALGNPSDAVPPMGLNSIKHPALNVHGLYTDDRAAEIDAGILVVEGYDDGYNADEIIPLWEAFESLGLPS